MRRKHTISIYCRGINRDLLEEMKMASYVICYDGFVVYKIKVKFLNMHNNCLIFHNNGIYSFYIPGFIRLSNSKTKVIVNDKYYKSVLFVKERVGDSHEVKIC